ncbi:MAG TPA: tetratricopeptide repeat protein, partial [Thermodesulfobacteriota bacterium]|nr:tetratricopeptide repeat protein [Thermodesulfobacteriota bacterium]
TSLKIDRKYAEAGPLRLAARSAYQLPWPLRDYARSNELLKEAIGYYPQVLRSWLYLGDTCFRMNKIAEAKAAYQRVLQLDPQGSEIREASEIKSIAQIKLNALNQTVFSRSSQSAVD